MGKYLNSTAICVLMASASLITTGLKPLDAQATATISGTVTDPSGAAVAGTSVSIRNVDTSQSEAVVSDSQGRYNASTLAIGNYEVQAAHGGFQTVIRRGIELTVGSQIVVDFALPVGQSQQTVTVQGEVSQVETTSAAVSNLVEQTEMRELPLNGRNFEQLITLAPGVTPIPTSGGFAGGGSTFYGNQQNYSIAGSRPSGQAFLLDDTDTSNFWNHGTGSGGIGSSLGVDAIAEFQTLTNTYTAKYGGSGSVINASSKSGTNDFHGSAYEFLRNSALEDRNYFDIQSGAPPFRRNQFGGTIGGPVRKDKMFFFVNYEGLKQTLVTSSFVTTPDANTKNFLLPTGPGGALVAVPQNPNPAVAAAMRNTLALWPTATSEILGAGGGPSGTGHATVLDPTIGNENYVLARFDYTISQKDTFFARYVSDKADRVAYSGIPSWPETDLTHNQYATIEERRIFSPTLVNLAHFSFVRTNESASVTQSPTVNGTNPLQFFPGSGREDGTINSFGGLTAIGASTTLPFYLTPNKFTVGDDVVWTHGAHNVTAGMNVQRLRENTWAPFDVGGVWNFQNLTTFLSGNAIQVVGQLPDSILSASNLPSADATKDWRELLFMPYVNDDWKVGSRLTLNIGIRYEPTTNAGQVRHLMENLLNAPYSNCAAGSPLGCGFVQIQHPFATNVSLKNYDPRVGVAWDPFPDHKTSIRAGFGTFHDVVIARNFDYWLQPPFFTGTQANPVYPGAFTGPISNSPLNITNGTYYGQTKTPYAIQYNLNIQREIFADTVATIGFVGARDVHLEVQRDYNPPVPFTGADGNSTFATLQGTTILANPRLNTAYNSLQLSNAMADSHYESLQASINRRFSREFQAQVSYTLSKSIDDSSGTYGLDGGGATTNPYSLALDRGLSNFSRTHNLRISSVYNLPFRRNQFVSGWQISGVGSYASGAPFSVNDGFARVYTGSASGGSSRPNFVQGCSLYPSQQTITNWFNTQCYAIEPIGEFGNLGRDTLIGPNLWNIDMALLKDTRITRFSETVNVQFRAEFFNIANHPSFANPNSNLFVQAGGGANPNPSVNLITATTSAPRQIQFGLKISF